MQLTVLSLALLALAGCPSSAPPTAPERGGDTRVAPDTTDVRGVREVRAAIAPAGQGGAEGRVQLTAVDGGVRVLVEADGLPPRTHHGLQVLNGRDCEADPSVHLGASDGSRHGSPLRSPPDRHAGDLGNVYADDGGDARYDRVDPVLRLDSTVSAVGRAVVLRARADDGATAPDGDAGAVVGCGVLEAVR